MDNIFGIGGPELLLILVLATVVLGPLRMIQMARGFGRLVRDLRNYSRELMSGLNEELAFLDEAKEAIQGGVDAASIKPEEVQAILPRLDLGVSGDSNASTSTQADAASSQPKELAPVSAVPEPGATIGTSVEWMPGQTNVGSPDQIPPPAPPGPEGSVSTEPTSVNTMQTSADTTSPAPPASGGHESDATVEPNPMYPDPI